MPRRYTLGKRAGTKDETRARIVAAALRIYGQRGVAAASNLAIARAADVAPATVRNHFSDPQDLANAAFDEVVAQLQPPTPAIFEDGTGIGERVTRLASELAAFYERSEPAWQLYRQEPDLIQAWSGGVDRYYANIDELMQNRARAALRRRNRDGGHGSRHRAADLFRTPGAWPVIEADRGSHLGARTPLVRSPGSGFGEDGGASAVTAAIHWAGPVLIAGSIVLGLAVVRISTRPVIGQTLAPDAAALLLIAAVLLLLALPAVYVFQAEAVGGLGLVGHALLSSGLVLLVVVAATPILHPSLNAPAGEHPLVFVLGIALAIGLLLTGVVTFQAGVFPRPAAGLVLAAMALFAFAFFVAEFLPPMAGQVSSALFGILLAAGFGWMGVALWQET